MRWLIRQGGAKALLRADLPERTVGMAWLGQAGFLLRCQSGRIVIDPYLSDHLAHKYQGSVFPHRRMMPAPIDAAELQPLDAVLCTHRHSDHMDPGTLPTLAELNPSCRFVVPAAERKAALKAGVPEDRMLTVNADQTVEPAQGISLSVIPAAHEQIEINERGEHRFLGLILRLDGIVVYHSGDCVPYDGLVQRLRGQRIDIALLPVNGRDEFRRGRGVPGNMTFDEAAELCAAVTIPLLVPHHFGMFDFNTVAPEDLTTKAARPPASVECLIPDAKVWYEFHA